MSSASYRIKKFNAKEINKRASLAALVQLMKLEYSNSDINAEIPQRLLIRRISPLAIFVNMPAYSDKYKIFINKIGSVIPSRQLTKNSVNSIIIALSTITGKPIAILDGNAVTNLKCAAITALVTDFCSKEDSKILGLIGSGAQAAAQIRGIISVRNIEQIQIYSRNKNNINNFINKLKHITDAKFIISNSAESVTENANIISTATTSLIPIIASCALEKPDIHINCFGGHKTESREIPLDIIINSVVITEDLKTAVLEAGDSHKHAIDIRDMLTIYTKHSLSEKRTIFSSTGHALLDLITVHYILSMESLLK